MCIFLFSFFSLGYTSAGAMAYTSAQSGNWNVNSTWSPSGTPGNGDTVTIADGHTVTCPIGITCIAGTSGANNSTAVTIGQAGVNPSSAKLIVAGTLVLRGNIVGNPEAGIRTTNYCLLTFNDIQ